MNYRILSPQPWKKIFDSKYSDFCYRDIESLIDITNNTHNISNCINHLTFYKLLLFNYI